MNLLGSIRGGPVFRGVVEALRGRKDIPVLPAPARPVTRLLAADPAARLAPLEPRRFDPAPGGCSTCGDLNLDRSAHDRCRVCRASGRT